VILTDMFGGTPSNLAISVMQDRDIEVIAGLNLPMLVKLARMRPDMEMREAVRLAAEAGRKYINVANDVLGK
jgi:PTS system mannose-specific IIA component